MSRTTEGTPSTLPDTGRGPDKDIASKEARREAVDDPAHQSSLAWIGDPSINDLLVRLQLPYAPPVQYFPPLSAGAMGTAPQSPPRLG
ncbi:unnamed protein product [Peronospora belbahrii]|uniref:Uncharacterized protein n=1 Tax=Peronospora belbahrii TaxID=622444 RepID=A0AAU9KUB4_9STRA|nr:unnamed protein product [Peronospora belbahrii]